jgi:FG-GAP-like repeat/Abnormal spindle-like microcephaly-assoc'd, ASPM-SPD-2-Hydin
MNSSSLSNAAVVRLLIVLSLLGTVIAPVVHAQVNFSTPPTFAGVEGVGVTIFVADFNGDGKPDILAADGTLNLGNGDGTFTAGPFEANGALAVADFNGDGKPDVLQQGTGTLVVLLGNGDGTFQPPISTNSGARLTLVAAADLNGDGKADVVGLSNNTTLLVYLNNGDGTFAAAVPYSLGSFQGLPQLVVFGDFNGDHKTDVAVITAGSPGQEIVLLGNGDGTFQLPPIVSTGTNGAISSVVGDFNGDGKLDLATSSSSTGSATAFLQLGNGDGTFQAPTTACTGPYSEFAFEFESIALAAADLNGDGKLDLVLTADLIGIYLGNGDGTFSSTPNYYQPMSLGKVGIAIADFNSDGKPDIAADGEILLGNGNGTFKGPPTVPLPNSAEIAVVGKFVNNGAPGVAAISSGNGSSRNTLYILTNDGTGALSLAHTYTLPQSSYAIATADVNGDGNLDLIVIGANSSGDWSYSVLLGNGDGSFQAAVLHQQSGQTSFAPTIAIADFNHDGKLDFAVPVGNSVAVLLGNGNGTFGSPTLFFDGGAASIVSADFNGDGKPDIAAAGPSGLAILLGNGDGTFQPAAFPYTTTGLFFSLLTGDLNGDGKADLVSDTNVSPLVFLGNGNGTFTLPTSFGTGCCFVGAAALADVNGDGKPDVVAHDAIGSDVSNGIFLGNGDGTFDPSQILIPYSYPAHSGGPSVQAVDVNGDGKPDLIIESPNSTVFVLINSTVAVPGTQFSPSSVTFPSRTVGTSSNPAPVILTNTGAVALTVKSVAFGGADAGEFKQTNNCTTVQPLTNCTINVTFAPTTSGASSANLIVTDNAATGSQQIAVSGTGTPVPGFSLSAPAPSPTSVSAGGSATTTVTVSSVGGFNQSVTLSCSSIMLNGSPATTDPPACKFSPSSISNASGASSLTIGTTGPTASLAPVSIRSRGLFYAMLLPILGIAVIGAGFSSRPKKPVRTSLACLMISGLLFLAACGGGSSGGTGGTGGTPPGTYTISISGSAGPTANATKVALTVQ